jgi:hypothetical protein
MRYARHINARQQLASFSCSPTVCRRRHHYVTAKAATDRDVLPHGISTSPPNQHLNNDGSGVETGEKEDLNCAQVARGCRCCTVHKRLGNPPELERARAFFSVYGIRLENHFFPVHGWRTRAKLAVRGSCRPNAPICLGLFQPGTHDVFHLMECPLHHPQINNVVKLVHKAVIDWRIEPYIQVPLPKKGKATSKGVSHGLLRYIQITTCATREYAQTHDDAPVQLVCVVNCSPNDVETEAPLRKMLAYLYSQHGPSSFQPLLHSIWLNFQQSSGNVILGEASQRLHGPQWAWHQYNEAMVALSPASFVQVSHNEKLVTRYWPSHKLCDPSM